MKLKPTGYQTAAASQVPGYLAKRFAQKRREMSQQAEERRIADELTALQLAKDLAERTEKVRPMKKVAK